MMFSKRGLIGLLVLAALLLSACQTLPAPLVAAAQTPAEDVTAAVLTTWDEYVASTLTSDVDRRLALWADDGVILRPGKAPVVGKEAIYERVAGSFSSTTYEEMTIDNVEVEVSGDMAFARGTYMVKGVANATGEPVFVDGTYMSIFKRQADGSWKLYRDMTHSNIPPTPPTDVNAMAEAVDAIWREYEASLAAGDVDRWMDLWTDDGVKLSPGLLPIEGKDAIREYLTPRLDAFAYDMTITNEEIQVGGEWAMARGVYIATLTPRAGGDDIPVDGKYMTLLQRQNDGSWKIHRDIVNSNVP